MSEKTISIFIDESGDFGAYDPHAPFYLVAMVLHDQTIDITGNILGLETHLQNLGYKQHAIHTGPLIRRESTYINERMEERRRLFNALFHFSRILDFRYICAKIKKLECTDKLSVTSRLSKSITDLLHSHFTFFSSFSRIIMYYDNGQTELTKVLTSVFHTFFSHVEFRRVKPADYKLFQVADLICTMELLAQKAETNSFTRSENEFFGSARDFKRNYLKPLRKKLL